MLDWRNPMGKVSDWQIGSASEQKDLIAYPSELYRLTSSWMVAIMSW